MSEPSVPTKSKVVSRHRWGRVLALQVLFEADLTSHDWRESLEAHAKAVGASESIQRLAAGWVEGVLEGRDEIDESITRLAPMWPLAQFSTVDRNILRLALFELSDQSPTPPKVAINEAVDLAKEFGGETSARFINGVLGAAMDERDRLTTAGS